ncbi:tumor necrosis factor a (TNF superfamily, member 2) [Antennarius striatus]|uniref:tumor necrosis factor a (TNF superfamily, member 2) n=1 Tax=Antennarius striatus TaxID=241820 RepID=UPI0035AFF6A6
MEGVCRVPLEDHSGPTTPRSPGRKLAGATLLVALCLFAGVALAFHRHTKGQGQDEDTFDLHHTLRQLSNARAAIHLEGRYNPAMKTSVEWRSQVDQSHSGGGLELDNNEIVIPENGLYFIYSQASFRVSCSSNADDVTSKRMVHLSHAVKRWSSTYGNDDTKKYYQTILYAVRTACQRTAGDPDQEGRWFTSVYTGAVFSLSKGDHLKTVMEEMMLANLEDEPGKTFFGVFAL